MTLTDYSPKRTASNWGGYDLSGWAEGTFINIARSVDNTTPLVGAAGDVGITLNADKTGTIEATFMQTSETNQVLSGVQLAQDQSGVLYRANFTIADPSGSVLMVAKNCHLMTPAAMPLADDQQSRTWVWFAEEINFVPFPIGVSQSPDKAARVANGLSTILENTTNINNAIG